MGSTAYDADGNVPVKYNIPWGAVRKGVLHYLGNALTVAKITLGGIVFDIGKQATEGLVVIGNGYSSVTFFLPDDRAVMTEEDGAAMSIYDYLEMLGTTDYSEIPAWDYFAQFVSTTVKNLISNSETEITAFTYRFQNALDLSGTADFSTVETAQDFFHTIWANLDSTSQANAKASPLSGWMKEDGAVFGNFQVVLDSSSTPTFPMTIGRR